MTGYFSEKSPPEVRRELQRSVILINGTRNDLVLACDTEMGFAICLMREPTTDGERYGPFKRDPNGYKERMATETIWGEIVIQPNRLVKKLEEAGLT